MSKNEVVIVDIESGFGVYFPFKLKDNFKQTFKSARWNPIEKRWEVGKNSKKRLEQWKGAVSQSSIAQEIDELEASELQQTELDFLNQELSALKIEIKKAKKQLDSIHEFDKSLIQVKLELSGARADLQDMRVEIEEMTVSVKRKKQQILDMLKGIVNIDLIYESKNIMTRNMQPCDSRKKQVFEKARLVIKTERNKLNEAGFESEGIHQLSTSNINRPDRDNPSFVTDEQIFNIYKLEENE